MFKIPNDFKVELLENEVIHQIAFGVNFISIFFNIGYIQIVGRFQFNDGYTVKEYIDLYPIHKDFGLLILLEKTIKKISVNSARDEIIIFFEKNILLKLKGEKDFESFRIEINGIEIVV